MYLFENNKLSKVANILNEEQMDSKFFVERRISKNYREVTNAHPEVSKLWTISK